MRGYIHLYTGNGKGKTTAALGLALRAVGAGKKIFIAQFVKGMAYAEVNAIQQFLPDISIKQYGINCFIFSHPTPLDIQAAKEGLEEVADIIKSGAYDMVILDEACIAIHYHLFSTEDLIRAINLRRPSAEIIITGRYATPQLIEMADLVTDMTMVKHYYSQGVDARKGIEY